jgi:hypothetical protein
MPHTFAKIEGGSVVKLPPDGKGRRVTAGFKCSIWNISQFEVLTLLMKANSALARRLL